MLSIAEVAGLRTNQVVQMYLMAGWLYNARGTVIMSDAAWDALCIRIDRDWDQITHPHRSVIDKPSLSSEQTAMYLTDAVVPLIARRRAVDVAGGGIDPGRSYIIPDGWPRSDMTLGVALSEMKDGT